MSPRQLKILKQLLNLSVKDRNEIINIINQPDTATPIATTSSKRTHKNEKYSVDYFKNNLSQDANFMSIVQNIKHQQQAS